MPRPKKDVVDDFVDRYLGFSAEMRKTLIDKLLLIAKIEGRLSQPAPPAQEPPKRKPRKHDTLENVNAPLA